ncbi:MAG: TonB-dependent receptor [Bacteroides sp.]|nr:TonB-dependent receptor [Bacteroides sp.]
MKDLITGRGKWLRQLSSATHWKAMLFLLVLLTGFTANAQNITVTGTVVDGTDEPMIGATVQVDGTKNVVVTDIDGNFTLKNVAKNATLVVSYIGYKTEKIAVDGQTHVKVQLVEDSESLDEVVVVGYGGTRARRDLTGSVGSVSGAKLAAVPVTSAAVALQGKVAGVQVSSVDGQPGADVNIRIRGTASVASGEGSDSNPLFIVDGFQQDNINDIPPSDIQSIDILKDASLTAIYGAKGGNGVVVVTTKSAQAGKTQVTFNGSLTFSHITKQLDLMDSYNFVDYQYDRIIGTSTRSSEAKKFRFNFGHPYDLSMYQSMPTHDWQDEVMGNTPMSYTANVTIGGGNDNTRYNISFTQSEDKGIIMNTGVRRTNINTKLNTKLGKNLTFTFNPKMTYRRDMGEGGEHVGTGGIIDVLLYRPTNGLREFGGWQEGVFDADDEAEFSYKNPVSDIERNLYKKHSYDFTNQASLEWKPISGLTLRTEGAYSILFKQTDAFYAVGTSKAKSNRNLPFASIDKEQRDKYIWTTTASYDFTLKEKHNFYALLGYEIQHSQTSKTVMQNRYFPHDITADKALSMMGMGENSSATSSKSTPQRLQSYFGQLNYNFDHKYLISLTARADGTSFYAKDNRWGFFPSVSAGWVLSEEEFMKDIVAINNLKIRAAIGKSGKNLTKADMWNDIYGMASSGGPGFGESTVDGELYYTISDYLPNPDIKWESTLTRNLAADISLFDNRLTITPEFYWNTTSDLLHRVTMLTNTGYKYQWQNIGQITNKGYEFTINAEILRGRDYNLSATFTLGANKMKVDKLNGTENEMGMEAPRYIKGYDMYRLRVGSEIGLMYGFVYDGLYTPDEFFFNPRNNNKAEARDGSDELHMPLEGHGKTVEMSSTLGGVMGDSYVGSATMPGKVKFKDLDNDGVITTADQRVIGNTTPKFQGGFSINGQWKNFDLTANFTYFLDFDVYNGTAQALSSCAKKNDVWNNVLANFSDTRWRYTMRNNSENLYANTYNISVQDYLDYNAGATMWNPGDFVTTLPLDYFVEDGSFLRCTDITLGYTFPKNLISKLGMSRFRLYGSVSNLFTITNYSGFDPEVDVMSGLTPSFDYNRYPRSRGYVIGVNVTF